MYQPSPRELPTVGGNSYPEDLTLRLHNSNTGETCSYYFNGAGDAIAKSPTYRTELPSFIDDE
jgi:hypothetical protein